MIEREESETVRQAVVKVAHYIDGKRWSDLRTLYASEVETDYTSLFGGSPQKQSGDALINGWRGALSRVTTQHLLGPIDVEISGSVVTAHCHVRAIHYVRGAAGGEYWEVLGHYRFELVQETAGWKIARMTLETQMQIGNTNLLAETAGLPK